MVDLSKFTSNKKIFFETVVLRYNQVCCQTLSFSYYYYYYYYYDKI